MLPGSDRLVDRQPREVRVRLGQLRGQQVPGVHGVRRAVAGEHGLIGGVARGLGIVARFHRPPVDSLRSGRKPLKRGAGREECARGKARDVGGQIADPGLADSDRRGRAIRAQRALDAGVVGGNPLHRLEHKLGRRVPVFTHIAAEAIGVPVRLDEADVRPVGAAEDGVVPDVVVANRRAAHAGVERVGHPDLDGVSRGLGRRSHLLHVRQRVLGVGLRHIRHAAVAVCLIQGHVHRAGRLIVGRVVRIVKRSPGQPVVVLPAPVALVADAPLGDALAGRRVRLRHPRRGHLGRARAVVDRHVTLRAERPRVGGELGEIKIVSLRTLDVEEGSWRRRVGAFGRIVDDGVVLPVVLVGRPPAAVVKLADPGRPEVRLHHAQLRRVGVERVPWSDVQAERSRGQRDRRDVRFRYRSRRSSSTGQNRSRQNCDRGANNRARRRLPAPPRQPSSSQR